MSLTTPSATHRHGRLLALVGVLVAFDVVAVAAAYVVGHLLLAAGAVMTLDIHAVAAAVQFDIVPFRPFVLVGTPLTIVAQSVFGYRMALQDVETAPDDAVADGQRESSDRGLVDHTRALLGFIRTALADLVSDGTDRTETPDGPQAEVVADRVAKLAHTAGMVPPKVRVIDAATPNSFVVSRLGERTLFVTTALVEALDGAELEAVLAHELAHLKNGDSVVMTAAAFLPTVTTRFVAHFVAQVSDSPLFRWLRGDTVDWDLPAVVKSYYPLVYLLFLLVSLPLVGTLYLASTACYRLLSRIREYSADAGGVAICGSPAAMASALETLTTDHRPEGDLRTAETGVRELCVLPYAIDTASDEEETDADPDRIDRVVRRWDAFCSDVLPGSHPEPEERIAALRQRQAALERAD